MQKAADVQRLAERQLWHRQNSAAPSPLIYPRDINSWTMMGQIICRVQKMNRNIPHRCVSSHFSNPQVQKRRSASSMSVAWIFVLRKPKNHTPSAQKRLCCAESNIVSFFESKFHVNERCKYKKYVKKRQICKSSHKYLYNWKTFRSISLAVYLSICPGKGVILWIFRRCPAHYIVNLILLSSKTTPSRNSAHKGHWCKQTKAVKPVHSTPGPAQCYV